jgi:hypothetical protein
MKHSGWLHTAPPPPPLPDEKAETAPNVLQ